MRSGSSILLIIAAGLTLVACVRPIAPVEEPCLPENDCVPPTAAELAPPLTPTGPPVEIAPESDPIRLQAAAAVPIENEDGFSEQAIRLIATPGDTGGLKRLYARFHTGGESDASVLYPIAEVASYAVVAERDHVLGIDLVEPVRDPASGQTRERHRRIVVTYVDGYEGVGDNTRYGVTSFTIAPAR